MENFDAFTDGFAPKENQQWLLLIQFWLIVDINIEDNKKINQTTLREKKDINQYTT